MEHVSAAKPHLGRTVRPARSRIVRWRWPAVVAVAAASFCLLAAGAQGFPNTQPDAAQQWYLGADNAWSAWASRPTLAPIKVAVIDSGIDGSDPAFAGMIAAGKSFVGGSWNVDTDGHGTFVAGIIAANAFNGIGTAGMAFNAKLLIAKVVNSYGLIPAAAEDAAIRWAANEGARVINLSISGLRDPQDSEFDTYSLAEREAVEYAYAKGAVVVAAVGNGTSYPTQPWPYAGYPAALPNVLSVAAVAQNGSVPKFSNRDPLRVGIAAPGVGIFSTIPENLIDTTDGPGCANDPYSSCGPSEFQLGNGTSFAAPQVAAAAALVLGVDPSLAPDQVDWLLERSATPGCSGCTVAHNAEVGWGRLDVAAAIAMLRAHVSLPPPDLLEPDDDTGSGAHRLGTLPLRVSSSEDYWDDPDDVFAVRLGAGQRVVASLFASVARGVRIVIWAPGTPDLESEPSDDIVARSTGSGAHLQLSFLAARGGLYYVEVIDGEPTRPRVLYTLQLAATGARHHKA
jgi:hypothetical protein